jgi:Na+/H+-translocating membrane pyrophosphatase
MSFFNKLLQPKSGQSSRRFIGLVCLIPLVIGTFVGIFSGIFEWYLVGMIVSFVTMMMAYFSLSWDKAKEIISAFTSIKTSSNTETFKTEEISNATESN